MLEKNFGLNTNGDSFLNMARWIPFSIIRKESFDVINFERISWSADDKEDVYYRDLKVRFDYLVYK
jgi:hypothetical protein